MIQLRLHHLQFLLHCLQFLQILKNAGADDLETARQSLVLVLDKEALEVLLLAVDLLDLVLAEDLEL